MLTATLVQYGFKLNPYDFCITNTIINDKQCTIIYYVDDTKVFHMELDIIKDVYNILQSKFRKIKIVYGKEHEFLDMKLMY